jgi:hypothetical protein
MFPCRIAAPFQAIFHIRVICSDRQVPESPKVVSAPRRTSISDDIPPARKNQYHRKSFLLPGKTSISDVIPPAKKNRKLKKITLH